jgi:hypothetical protein
MQFANQIARVRGEDDPYTMDQVHGPAAAAGARGRKGPRGSKSETESAVRRRIQRAQKAGRPVSKEDLEMLQKSGVKGRQTVGGTKVSNLRRRKKLADSFSQRELLRQLTLISR